MTNETVRVAAVAMHSEMGEPEANLSRLEEWTRKAHAEGAAFALFTEECITGSMNKSDLTVEEVHEIARRAERMALPFLERMCAELEMTLVVGTIESVGGGLKNSAYIVGPEGHLATFSKVHLPGRENDWFIPGDTLPVVTSQAGRSRSASASTRGSRAVPDGGGPRGRVLPAGGGLKRYRRPDRPGWRPD